MLFSYAALICKGYNIRLHTLNCFVIVGLIHGLDGFHYILMIPFGMAF